jgi:hypothetical protein
MKACSPFASRFFSFLSFLSCLFRVVSFVLLHARQASERWRQTVIFVRFVWQEWISELRLMMLQMAQSSRSGRSR